MEEDFTKDDMLARWLSNELSESEKNELEGRPDFQDYQRLVEGVKSIRPPDYNAQEALAELKKRRSAQQAKTTKVIHLKPVYWMGIAATLLALAIFWFWSSNDQLKFVASSGKMELVALPDGSSVRLNAGSSLGYENKANQRLAVLEGEGYFEVQKQNQPFVVQTELGTVTVLGTSFNVYNREGVLRISCQTGRVGVQFANQAENYILGPGESVSLDDEGTIMENALDEAEVLDWLDGRSVFQSRPLREILSELERQFELEFQLPTTLDLNERLQTAFPNDSVDQALDIIDRTLDGVSFERQGKQVLVRINQ